MVMIKVSNNETYVTFRLGIRYGLGIDPKLGISSGIRKNFHLVMGISRRRLVIVMIEVSNQD